MNEYKRQISKIKTDAFFEDETVILLKSISQGKEKEMKTRKIIKTVLIAATAALLLTFSVGAAIKYLTPDQVAGNLGDDLLSDAFKGEDAFITDQSFTGTNSANGEDYTVRFYGAVKGKDISAIDVKANGYLSDNGEKFKEMLNGHSFDDESYYFVFSFERADGEAFDSERDGNRPIMISPLVNGTKPWDINIFAMEESSYEFEIDNVTYSIITFAGFDSKDIRLFAYEGIAPGSDKFLYNEETGNISINPDFKGFIHEFELPAEMK